MVNRRWVAPLAWPRLQYSPLQLNATGRRKIPSSLGCWRCRRPRMSSRAAVEQLQLQLQLGGLPSALGPRVNSPTALRQDEQRLVTASGRPLPTGPVLLSFIFGATLRQLLRPGSVLLRVACLDVFDAAAADEWLLVTRVLLSKVANVEKERVRYAVLSRWVSVPNIRALIQVQQQQHRPLQSSHHVFFSMLVLYIQ